MRTFTIPTIYTAVDRMSTPFRIMSRNAGGFSNTVAAANARSERLFRRLTPHLSEASRQFVSIAGTAAVAGAAISGIVFSARSIMEYETELASLQAITGLTGKEFDIFKGKIEEVAKATGKNTIEVTEAFTAIANNQPELLKSAADLAAVTQSTILLAQASKMELQPAGEALTQILNQFGKGAKEAAKTIDILAAGSVAGSSEIRDTADAIKEFGAQAASMGIKINESVALIELGSKFQKGTEAGIKFRNILGELSKGKAQDKQALKDWAKWGVNIQTLTNKSLPLTTRLKEIAKIAKDDVAIIHTFGKENQVMATGVLQNIDKLDGMIEAVDTQGMAAAMAAKNTATFTETLKRLSNKWINMVTTSKAVPRALEMASKAIEFLTNHLDTIVSVGGKVLLFFAAWKTSIAAVNIATDSYNAAVRVARGVQMAWNLALSASPLGIAIAATAGLTLAAYGLYRAIKSSNVSQSIANDLQERSLENTIDQRARVIELFTVLKQVKVGSDAYNQTLAKIDEIQPGIIDKYQLQAGALKQIAAAENELTKSIMKRAEEEAKVALFRESIRNKLELQAQGPSTFQKIVGAMGGPNADLMNRIDIAKEDERIAALSKLVSPELINPKSTENDDLVSPQLINPKMTQNADLANRIETTNNAKVSIEVDAHGADVSAKSDSKSVSVKPRVGSTMIN